MVPEGFEFIESRPDIFELPILRFILPPGILFGDRKVVFMERFQNLFVIDFCTTGKESLNPTGNLSGRMDLQTPLRKEERRPKDLFISMSGDPL